MSGAARHGVMWVIKNRNAGARHNCARGLEAMAREVPAYWQGMAMHRKNPRRMLAAELLLRSNQ